MKSSNIMRGKKHFLEVIAERATMMKIATVYQRDVAILVHPSSRTIDGVWILSEPCVRLSSDCTNIELGDTVLSALDGSNSSVPHPTDWKRVLEPLLKAAGVKSWMTFAKNAICVQVEEQDGILEVIPTVNLGSKHGFQSEVSQKKSLNLPCSSDTIGSMILQALTS